MGSYSNFEDEDIKIINLEGLKIFLKRWSKTFSDNVVTKSMRDILKEDEKGNWYATFEGWDNIKLVSYWYSEECLFLYCIGKYIRGYVRWGFENDDESGYVEFTDNGTVVHTGVMQWHKWKPTENIDDKKEYNEFMLLEDI